MKTLLKGGIVVSGGGSAQLDVLVDGRFVEELKDISLRFRGSRNQRLIDMKKTLAAGKIVLLPDLDRKSGRQVQS